MEIYAERGPIRLRTLEPGDVEAVTAELRDADLMDIAAVTRVDPAEAVASSVRRSDRRFTVDFHGECAAVAGVTFNARPGLACVWLLGRPLFDRTMAEGGWRVSRPWLEIMSGQAKRLYNYVPEHNPRTRRWLEWVGFRPTARHENFRGLGAVCIELQIVLDAAGSLPSRYADRRTPQPA